VIYGITKGSTQATKFVGSTLHKGMDTLVSPLHQAKNWVIDKSVAVVSKAAPILGQVAVSASVKALKLGSRAVELTGKALQQGERLLSPLTSWISKQAGFYHPTVATVTQTVIQQAGFILTSTGQIIHSQITKLSLLRNIPAPIREI
jgi:hypothetical protein